MVALSNYTRFDDGGMQDVLSRLGYALPATTAAPVATATTPVATTPVNDGLIHLQDGRVQKPFRLTDAQIKAMDDGHGHDYRDAIKEKAAWDAANPAYYPAPAPIANPTQVTPHLNQPATPAPPVVATPTPATSVANTAQDTARNNYLNLVDQKFGADYGTKAISSSLLDDTINSILADQHGSAQQFLDRGKARGIYNDVGYGAGLATLGSDDTAARSKLSSMGSDILSKYRTDANTVRDNAYSAASNYQTGRTFSLDPYINQGNDVIARAKANAGGDLLNTLGGTNLYDFSTLANKSGQAQGAVNLRDADVATALAERKRKNGLSRGLGSTGAF